MCSTPFGITDYFGHRQGAAAHPPYECSTPFGITDYFGRPVVVVAAGEQCSTPFGITDYFGGRPLRAWPALCNSAQRLSASRIISVALADAAGSSAE